MAIFHMDAKVISRGKGQSAIAAAAYRSGDHLRDEAADEVKHYRARRERIEFTAIMAPKDAPEWARDRGALWNGAERAEKRKDAQLAREFEIALPHELTAEQREWLVKDFAREAFVRRGYAVDIAIHSPDKGSDSRNHHAHLMVTMRTLGPEGFAALKDRSLNTPQQLTAWREQWAHLANRHLERHGHAARIDHRSLKAQGIDREPTIHLGYAANEMAKRGASSDRMAQLQGIMARNDIRLELRKVDAELATLERDAAQTRLGDAARREPEGLGPLSSSGVALARFADAPKAQEVRRERLDGRMADQPEGGGAKAQSQPEARAPSPAREGLKVVNSATGALSGLGDFLTGLLAGSAAPVAPEPLDLGRMVGDPAYRKQRQLAVYEEQTAEAREERAAAGIKADMERGKPLCDLDIMHLNPQHQRKLLAEGDSALRLVIEAVEKRARSRGDERERDE